MPLDKVLLVDDEESVLHGLERTLHGEFDLHVAAGGHAGLAAIRNKGPFAVVVSDMRMPGMNGATFLANVRALKPLTTRMLLTGYSDVQAAAEAINKGHIFGFLNKPCSREELCAALAQGVEKYKESVAEKQLLEGTLIGIMRTLSEVLSVVNPLSFERSNRISSFVKDLIATTVLEQPWQIEAAALLSQIGCLVEPPDLIRAAHRGTTLSPEQMKHFSTHPQTASDLLLHIPRMQGVAWMIRNQNGLGSEAVPAGFDSIQIEELELGAEMLRMAITFDTLWLQGLTPAEIESHIRQTSRSFPQKLLDSLNSVRPPETRSTPKLLPVALLAEGMIVDEDITNKAGTLLVGSGQPISKALLVQLRKYADAGIIRQIHVIVST